MLLLLLAFTNIFATSHQEACRDVVDMSISMPDDSLGMKLLEEQIRILDSLSVNELLMLWHIDSTTCLRKRSSKMVDIILDSIPIIGKSLDYVTSILGTPYSVIKGNEIYFDSTLKKNLTGIRAVYFVDAYCENGKPVYNGKLSSCWFYIEFSPDSLRAKSYGSMCN